MPIDWAAEASISVDGIVRDSLAHPDPGAAWDELIEARLLAAEIEPAVGAAMCVEAVGLTVLVVQIAAAMLGRDPVEFLDQIQRWRGTPTAG